MHAHIHVHTRMHTRKRMHTHMHITRILLPVANPLYHVNATRNFLLHKKKVSVSIRVIKIVIKLLKKYLVSIP